MANPTHNPAAQTQAARNPAPVAAPKTDAAEPKTDADDRKAQLAKVAPHCDAAFAARFDLDDDYLDQVARGEIPPPPFVPENDASELHFRAGAWVITAKGVDPDEPVAGSALR